MKLLSLALKIIVNQLGGAGKYKQNLDNCPDFIHEYFYDVICPINWLSLCCQYICNLGRKKVNSSKISPAKLN